MKTITFNHRVWLEKFQAASAAKSGFRELRVEIFRGTVDIVHNDGYQIGGRDVQLNSDSAAGDTEYFTAPPKLPESLRPGTRFSVIEADCLETAGLLLNCGFNPCVLNMASRQNPGGGVTGGAGAQEENIFRRTNLFKSLYQFADYADEYGIERSRYSYPLDRNTGGIYSANVTVFRASEHNGYALLKKPYRIVFSIIDDHNSRREHNPEGNVLPFLKVFDEADW